MKPTAMFRIIVPLLIALFGASKSQARAPEGCSWTQCYRRGSAFTCTEPATVLSKEQGYGCPSNYRKYLCCKTELEKETNTTTVPVPPALAPTASMSPPKTPAASFIIYFIPPRPKSPMCESLRRLYTQHCEGSVTLVSDRRSKHQARHHRSPK